MQLNQFFIANIQGIYGNDGVQWLQELPNTIKQLALEWHFDLINPLSNLSYNFLGIVKLQQTGMTAILKMAPAKGSLANEVRWLKCVAEGVPTVYDFHESFNAILLEYLQPGMSLKNLVKIGKDEEATRILCSTIRHLQSRQHKALNFKHLSELAKSLSILRGRYDKKLLSQAESLFRDLTADTSNDVVLHGDLHHDNILSCGHDWKAIDPHGYVGDPAAEVGAMMRNPFDCFPTDKPLAKVIEQRLKILTEELSFDAQKIKAWIFCMTVLSDAWTAEDQPDNPESKFDIAVVSAINNVKIW